MSKKEFAEWSTAEKNDLPDSSFAYIEEGGTKDSEGKTTPRSLRHLPYKDKDGKVDLPHTRNALARLDQTEGIPAEKKAEIKTKLENALKQKNASSVFAGIFPYKFDDAVKDGVLPTWIQLIPIGSWDHAAYGPIVITASDIEEFKRNFDADIRKGVYITAGHEGQLELPAVGWLTAVEKRVDGLWGMVEWNELGKATLRDKQYKFYSPEFYLEYADPETHEVYEHVLTGGALTKSPYFKELEAVVFSDKNLQKNFTDSMNIGDILKKKKAERTAAERKFLKEHMDDMTEAQKKSYDEEGTDDGDDDDDDDTEAGKKKNASDKAAQIEQAKKLLASEGVVTMSSAEHALLSGKADKGAEALARIEAAELNSAVGALIFDSKTNTEGRFLPKDTDAVKAFVEGLKPEQRKTFAELIALMPKAGLFTERGDTGSGSGAGSVVKEVEAKIATMMKADDKLSYTEAVKAVFAEGGKSLQDRYDAELQGRA